MEDQRTLNGFNVHLPVFQGPFELLLSLIAKHQLDVTQVALSIVTDDFLAFIKQRGDQWDLGQATEFLVVAATLLDLKVASLLPGEPGSDNEDLALLEARDLLFARLLQYRAYKQASLLFAGLMAVESQHHPRTAGPDPAHLALLPEVVVGIDADDLAQIAQRVLTPRPEPEISIGHVHAPKVNVREQMLLVLQRLSQLPTMTFRALCSDCSGLLEVVGRFLAVLELFREDQVGFVQAQALGELQVTLAVGALAQADQADWSRRAEITSDAQDQADLDTRSPQSESTGSSEQ